MVESQSSRDAEKQNEEEHNSSTEDANRQQGAKAKVGGNEAPKKLSKIKELWAKTGLDIPTITMMIKAAIPPTIAIAMYEATAVAEQFTTLGYLVAITSILGFCIMPRSKFIQTMFLNIISICIGTAVQLLAIWSAIQARYHTTPPGSTEIYNSSASAVCGVWLFFQVYLINSVRSARPQLQFPAILYSIFVNVGMSYGPSFTTTAAGVAFGKRLLTTFLTGFGLATGVSLFIFPVTQRKIVFKEITGYIHSLRGLLKSQIKYTASLEHIDMFQGKQHQDEGSNKNKIKRNTYEERDETADEKALKGAVEALKGLHSKLTADLVFAKREIAYGKLGPKDLSQIFILFRAIFLPLIGLPTLIDIFKRVAHIRGWDKPDAEMDEDEQKVVDEWQDIMKMLHSPFAEIGAAMDKAFQHALIRLELIDSPKTKSTGPDEEAETGSDPNPGSDKFTEWFEHKTNEFYRSREVTLREWCEHKGIALADDSFETHDFWAEEAKWEFKNGGSRDQRQLFVLLFIEYLLHSASLHVFDLIKYADSKVSDGTMAKKRLIVPGVRRVKKWFLSVLSADEDANEDSYVQSMDGAQDVYLGEAFDARKDPEHLPPVNAFQKAGNVVRQIPRLLRSPHSVFGFRVACATMSIGIIAYLQSSSLFFIQQRLVWSMIMVAISMTRTSGQSLFNFVLRVFGTFCAMVASLLIYYIPDGHTAGIIVFLFIWEAACFYIVLKKPQFVVVGIISAVTVVLVIGYELQVRKIGVEAATSNGQPAYNIYLLAPYRLATVAGGLAVAWIWTIFPFPVTEHSELRKELGSSMYLMANFYAIVHERIAARVRGDQGSLDDKRSPASRLDNAATKVFSKELLLLDRIKLYGRFTRFELLLGGRFPQEKYNVIIKLTENILNYTALMSYASRSFARAEDAPLAKEVSNEDWQRDFRHLLSKVSATSHDITTRLCLLSSAVASGKPLPPYLAELQPFKLAQRLQEIDRDILSVRHIAEPGYAAFAVMQISSRSVLADLNRLTDRVKELVGELDFSFHIVTTASNSSGSVDDVTGNKGKRD